MFSHINVIGSQKIWYQHLKLSMTGSMSPKMNTSLHQPDMQKLPTRDISLHLQETNLLTNQSFYDARKYIAISPPYMMTIKSRRYAKRARAI